MYRPFAGEITVTLLALVYFSTASDEQADREVVEDGKPIAAFKLEQGERWYNLRSAYQWYQDQGFFARDIHTPGQPNRRKSSLASHGGDEEDDPNVLIDDPGSLGAICLRASLTRSKINRNWLPKRVDHQLHLARAHASPKRANGQHASVGQMKHEDAEGQIEIQETIAHIYSPNNMAPARSQSEPRSPPSTVRAGVANANVKSTMAVTSWVSSPADLDGHSTHQPGRDR